MILEKLKKEIYKYQYNELSDYAIGIRDLLNLLFENEDITENDIIKEIKRLQKKKKE